MGCGFEKIDALWQCCDVDGSVAAAGLAGEDETSGHIVDVDGRGLGKADGDGMCGGVGVEAECCVVVDGLYGYGVVALVTSEVYMSIAAAQFLV